MGSVNSGIYSLNAGMVGKEAMGRIDLSKMRLTAEDQTNLLPTVLGPAKFRPGFGYFTGTKGNDEAWLLPFVVNVTTKAKIELTDGYMRVVIDGVPLTRPAVTAAVTNGNFTTNLSGWTDADEAGASSTWASGAMVLVGTGPNSAIRKQTVAVTETGTEHALRIIVSRGPVQFRVGSADDLGDYIAETSLGTGEHSLAFTPTGNFYIRVASSIAVERIVDSINVEAAGEVEIETPWAAGVIPSLRYAQSGDVLFCACDGIQQKRIERRSQRSWSLVEYVALDGPYRFENTTPKTITPSDIVGNITLTASDELFDSGHVGSIWRLTHYGQTGIGTLNGDDQFTNEIRVSGVASGGTLARRFNIDISGTFTATVTLQRSFAEPGAWEDVISYTAPVSTTYSDTFDNQIVYYRLGIKIGNYTSGTVDALLTYAGSIQIGAVRITAVSSGTSASAEVMTTLGRAEATKIWAEGEWSGYRGFPSSVVFHDGRLWWGWRDYVYGSVSDAYSSFDQNFDGDGGPIIRSVATGGFERIFWLLSNQRLLAGTGSQEISIRASSFDEPLTPTQFTARAPSERGSYDIQAVKVDARGVFVQGAGKRIFELVFDVQGQDFSSNDLTRLFPEICEEGVRSIAVQRQPDTRIWFVLNDGTCAVLTYEVADDVVGWTRVVTSEGSLFKSVCVLPGEVEDEVWMVVERPFGFQNLHYIEKMARADECIGGTLSKNMDSYLVYSGAATTTISGLDHLAGLEVAVWADGQAVADTDNPELVSSLGIVTLSSAVSNAVIGIPYDWRFKSSKLAHSASAGTALLMKKKVSRLGLLMRNVVASAVRVGRDFTNLRGMPAVYKGKALTTGQVLEEYDQSPSSFDGSWDTDSRLCMEGASPYPVTLMGVVLAIETNEGFSMKPKQGDGQG